MKTSKWRWLIILLVFVALSFFINYFYKNYLNKKINTFDECVKQNGGQVNLMYPPTCTTKDGRSFIQKDKTIPNFDFSTGWYWGKYDQKKPGTPSDWVYTDAGRNSCWHETGAECSLSPEADGSYKCPENSYVNCMPSIDNPELRWECTSEYQEWAKTNCPGYEGVAY